MEWLEISISALYNGDSFRFSPKGRTYTVAGLDDGDDASRRLLRYADRSKKLYKKLFTLEVDDTVYSTVD